MIELLISLLPMLAKLIIALVVLLYLLRAFVPSLGHIGVLH